MVSRSFVITVKLSTCLSVVVAATPIQCEHAHPFTSLPFSPKRKETIVEVDEADYFLTHIYTDLTQVS